VWAKVPKTTTIYIIIIIIIIIIIKKQQHHSPHLNNTIQILSVCMLIYATQQFQVQVKDIMMHL